MKERVSFLAGLCLLLIGIDQLSKGIFQNLFELDLILFKITPFRNYGIFSGLLKDASPMVTVVSMSIIGCYLFCAYVLLMYFLRNKKLARLKFGVTVYIAGLLGNIIDKIFRGYVIDFINLKIPGFENFIFNFADILQIVAVIILISSFWIDYNAIWFPDDKRKTFLINFKFQSNVVFVVISILSLQFITFLVFGYSYMNSLGTSLDTVHQFVLGLVIIFILFSIGVIFFLFIYTHRMTGPILALLRFAKNPQGNLKLRKGDLHEKEIIEISTFLGPIS